MLSLKCVVLFAACLILAVSALPAAHFYDPEPSVLSQINQPALGRHIRSPKGGHIDLDVKKDQSGSQASVNYNQNIFTSHDGRGSVDAYAQASRDFSHNRNDFSGGIRGSWKF
ncbi:uncharacterized protein LOC119604025 [Lucilia sericata]|uniref:uncharacterized protein LOC119604025 n=1 Tax=Lucilia sericata TaxID=13632 RepID=UPI0018A8797F|nr:uncharacterized protein LOC119604025 [Lucilia sericata]